MIFRRFLPMLIAAGVIALSFQGSATASVLAAFNNTSDYGPACSGTPSSSSTTAGFADPFVTASSWTLTRGSGGCDNATGFSGLHNTTGDATFTFGLTSLNGGSLSQVSFHESNNDCESGGFPFCSTGATWEIDESINGGAASVLGTFSSGAPYVDYLLSYNLSGTLSAGDSVVFSVFNTSGPVVSTANYGIYTGEIDGIANAPEPASVILLGSALGFAAMLRRRAIKADL
jgi:hypothetical protein